jgi:hypothetical protein
VALRIRVVPLFLFALSCDRADGRILPAGPEPYRSIHHGLVIDLPDTGGFLLNGQAAPKDSMLDLLRMIYEPRPSSSHALFLRVGPHREWEDVEYVRRVAAEIGVQSFGYYETWPELRKLRTVHADST